MGYLTLENISFSYDEKEIFKEFSLRLRSNSITSVLGPSGCGKSTLLKIIGGIVEYDGEVRLDEDILSKEQNAEVGLVFQDINLFPWKTVKENILFGNRIRNEKFASTKIDKMLIDLGLEGRGNDYPESLSGGMQQRVALLRCIANNPKVVLMDEPFGSLDFFTRENTQKWLMNFLEGQQRTILIVTHDINEAMLLSDEIIVLSNPHSKVIYQVKINASKKNRIKDLFNEYFNNLRLKIQNRIRSEMIERNVV